jgi:hypothetical protein
MMILYEIPLIPSSVEGVNGGTTTMLSPVTGELPNGYLYRKP